MIDPTEPREVIVDGKKVIRPAPVADTDHTEYCLASQKEVYAHAYEKTYKPCAWSEGVPLGDFAALEQYRQDLKNGIRRKECRQCWQIEDAGGISPRVFANKQWLDPYHGNSHTEIILSNNCNSSCIYCNSRYSSQWKKDIENSKEPLPSFIVENPDLYQFTSQPLTEKDISDAYEIIAEVGRDYKKLACIGVYGGEPGLDIIEQDHLGNVLRTFFENNRQWNRFTRYDFQTSLNYSNKHCLNIYDYFKKYKDLYPNHIPIIQPSFESTGNLFNYIRYRNDFSRFDKNLKVFLQDDIFDIEINASTSIFSLAGLVDFLEYANHCAGLHKRVKITFMKINYPHFFRLELLDESFLKHIENARKFLKTTDIKLNNEMQQMINTLDDYEKSIGNNLNNSEHILKQGIEFINWIEKDRSLKLKDVNPELHSYFLKMSSN